MAIPHTSTEIWSTTLATDSTTDIWIDTGTGGPFVQVYNPYASSGEWSTLAHRVDANIDKISKAVTKKDLKMIKDEVRKYMKDQMIKDAKEIAGKLFEDIEKLKKDKTQLKKEVTELKIYLKKAKVEIQEEIEGIEEMLERRANAIGKFKYLDFSDDK